MSKYIDPHTGEVIECIDHGTHCKFCKKPITIQVAKSYDLGDPLKLIPLACCNECADLRNLKIRLEGKIRAVCTLLNMAGKNATSDLLNKSRESLKKLTMDYAEMIPKFHQMRGGIWDEAVVDEIMNNPLLMGEILTRMWKMFKEAKPYKHH